MSMGRGIMAIAVVGGTCIAGYSIMAVISPSRETMLQKLPEGDPAKMAESRARSALMMAKLKEVAESDKPFWMEEDRDGRKR
ncbi:PREDICTED: ubiquinol-cytochrome-c reductase complex assembly factor 3-like [Branchiostoma belcheri]|uniref:Ubiquinol-cytochrome-c reductase complex assembly factor 3-like n=1 Tax=Branchiostoma belcheri TaxID=7741 RepID=A0A6P5APA3_BRABE|nr:PREDICTED: ubiquinol-cytochrome-c reductase complex assembly factor 3-like [Branchiostoma belcheri]